MNKILMLFTFSLLCLFSACSAGPPEDAPASSEKKEEVSSKAAYQKISAEDAKAMMEDGSPYILLDVRTEEEFQEKRIDQALLIPDYELSARATKELPDKNARILIYCRSGRRSAIAANKLVDMGYTQVYDFGGIIDWPYDTISG